MLNIKPAILVENGDVQVIGKALGTKMSFHLLNKLIDKYGPVDYDLPYAFAYSCVDNTMIKKYLKLYGFNNKNDDVDNQIYLIGSTIGTHAGPCAYAIAYFKKE